MTTSAIKRNEHIPELNIVRAIAIIGVLAVHASASATISMKESSYFFLYNFANIFMKFGTPTFILLSSFVLFYSYYNRPLDRKLIAGFYKKRLLYIIIPYIIFTALYSTMYQVIVHQPILSEDAILIFLKKLMWGKGFAHLYFVFISIQFYLLFPIVLFLSKKWKSLVHWFIPIGFAIQWGFVFFNKYVYSVQNKGSWSFSYFAFFFLGAAIGIYYPRIKQWIIVNKENATGKRISVWLFVWAAWLVLGISHVVIYYNSRVHGTPYNSLLFEFLWSFHSIFSALVMIQAAFIIYRSFPKFIKVPLFKLGQYSFGIYLIHLIYLTIYDRYVPTFGISYLAHLKIVASWFFMLGASWLSVAFFAKFVPLNWIVFGNLPKAEGTPMFTKQKVLVTGLAAILIVTSGAVGIWMKSNETSNTHKKQPLEQVVSEENIAESYDLIVAGTDPEGVVAAVSAARNGLKVLLVDGRNREILGGLMTIGELNSLDPNYSPKKSSLPGKKLFLNKGIFQEWYDQIEGTSFDTNTAANVFNKLVAKEENIHLLMKAQSMTPIVEAQSGGNATIKGLHIVKEDGTELDVLSSAVIDATQDGDIAAASGVPYTIGREDAADPTAQMAVTLVFKMSGVTPEIWKSFAKHKNTGIDSMSAWGFPDAKDYVSSNPERVKMRGLNIGRQNDETMLINAMHIFKVNPLDPASVEEALAIGRAEAPRIVDYLKKTFVEFKDLEFAGTAEELYVRESRHIQGEYRLTMADLMDNRDFWDAIAYGSYKVDIQSTSHKDDGVVMLAPIQYGVPFRSLVPLKVDGLLVVGRAASFDSIPHGSARVIPLGMATGEAAGAAVKLAMENQITLRELSQSKELIAELRSRLTEQGMDLTMNTFEAPSYKTNKAYKGLVAAVSMLLTSGSNDNSGFDLDGASNVQRFYYHMLKLKKFHPEPFIGDPAVALTGVNSPKDVKLTLEQAIRLMANTIDNAKSDELTLDEMMNRGWIKQETIDLIDDRNALSNGEAFMLIRDVLEFYGNFVYE